MTRKIDHSLTKIREFFAANPDEELSVRDASVKMGMHLDTARYAIRALLTFGEIAKVRVDGTTVIYGKPSSLADAVQIGGSHYKDMPIQPWEVMEAVLTPEEFRGFLKGNILKYSMRAGRKEGSDDAGKAQHYRQKLAEVMHASR